MIRVTLEIDNKTAHSCSPVEFLRKFILLDAKFIHWPIHEELKHKHDCLDTPYALINIKEIEQI